jgi:anti-anti-sigma factor
MTNVSCLPASARDDLDQSFSVHVRSDGPRHVVALSGDLDLSSREHAFRTCVSTEHVDVVVDLADLNFMDCAGYGMFVTARTILRWRGGSLNLVGPAGQPRRLLTLISAAFTD